MPSQHDRIRERIASKGRYPGWGNVIFIFLSSDQSIWTEGSLAWTFRSTGPSNRPPPTDPSPPGAFTLAVPLLPLTRPMTRDALSMLASSSSCDENLSLQRSHSSQESQDRLPM